MKIRVGNVYQEPDTKRKYIVTYSWEENGSEFDYFDLIYLDDGETLSGAWLKDIDDTFIKHYKNWKDAIKKEE